MDSYRIYNSDYQISNKQESFIVEWQLEDEHRDPTNWSLSKKFACTALLSLISFLVTFASTIGSGTYDAVSKEFGVSKEVSEMTTSLFLVGFAIGAPILAPVSEEVGRLPIYVLSMFLFSLFQIGAATSKNMASLAICRFFAGFFGTTPLSNAGGSIADIWEVDMRTIMFPFFGVSGFIGPTIGPVAGSYITASKIGWRWTNYLVAIIGFFVCLACFLLMPETYRPIIMDLKAASIRKKTQDSRYFSLHEAERKGKSLFSLDVFLRPFMFALTEPIVSCFTMIITITYIVLFTDFEAYPIIFATWGFSTQKSTLPFIAVCIGLLTTLFLITPITYHFFRKEVRRVGSFDKLHPEIRLVPLMFCCWTIPVSLFWLGWTSYKSISPWCAIVSTYFFGIGMIQVFLTTYGYIIDAYGSNSASALSTLTLVRYNVSAGMVHVAEPMYQKLNIHWASSLLAFISLIICIVPFVFYIYGPKIRSYSKYTRSNV